MMLFITVFYEKTRAKKVFASIYYCLGLKPEAIEQKAIEPVAKV
jgi:hypothetical protein